MDNCTLNGKNLKKVRNALRWSQTKLGEMAGEHLSEYIDYSTISRMENDYGEHRLDYVEAIAKVISKECGRKLEVIKRHLQIRPVIPQKETFILEKTKDVYQEHFNSVSLLRRKILGELNHFLELEAAEIKLSKLGKRERFRDVEAIKTFVELIREGKNLIIFGISGIGKTFICLQLFELTINEYLNSDLQLNKKIPLFFRLSRIQLLGFYNLLKENINDDTFINDKNKYVIFMDGLNEVGDTSAVSI